MITQILLLSIFENLQNLQFYDEDRHIFQPVSVEEKSVKGELVDQREIGVVKNLIDIRSTFTS